MSMMETHRDTARPWRIAAIIFAFIGFGAVALAGVGVACGVVAGVKGDRQGWVWAAVAVVLAVIGLLVRAAI